MEKARWEADGVFRKRAVVAGEADFAAVKPVENLAVEERDGRRRREATVNDLLAGSRN